MNFLNFPPRPRPAPGGPPGAMMWVIVKEGIETGNLKRGGIVRI